jgi:ABC-type glycerol-3-phosphate transport system substrate-binding protein
MKRILIFILLCLCSSSCTFQFSSRESVTLTFAAFPTYERLYAPVIEQFHQSHPHIRIQFVSLLSQSDGSLRAEEVATLADTALVVGIDEPTLKSAGFANLEAFLSTDSSLASGQFHEGLLSGIDSNAVYQLPVSISVPLLAYNRALWTQASLPEPQMDWQQRDLLSAVQQIAALSSGSDAVYGLFDGTGYTAIQFALAESALSRVITDLSVTDPLFEGVLERARTYIDTQTILVPANATEISSPELQQLIIAEQLGVWPNNYSQPLMNDNAFEALSIGIAPYPDDLDMPISIHEGYVMSSGTRHPDAAWEWLRFLSNQVIDTPDQVGGNVLSARRSTAQQQLDALDAEMATALEVSLQRLDRVSEPRRRQVSLALAAALADVRTGTAPRIALNKLTEQSDVLSGTNANPPAQTTPVAVATPVPTATNDTNVIRFLFFGGISEQRIYQQLADQFTAVAPDIRVEPVSAFTVLQGSITPDRLIEVSDCFSSPFSFEQDTLQRIALDLSPFVDADSAFDLDDYPPVLLDAFRVSEGEALYALPHEITLRLLQYNPELFDAFGVDYPRADWQLNDLLFAAQQLSVGEADDRIYGFFAPDVRHIPFVLNQFGVQAAMEQGGIVQPNFTHPEVRAALQWYVELLQQTSSQEQLQGYDLSDIDRLTTYNLVAEGRVGMWLDFGELQGDNYPTEVIQRLRELRAITLPPLGSAGLSVDDFTTTGLYIAATTASPDDCWRWLNFMSQAPQTITNGFYPARASVAQSEALLARTDAGAAALFQTYHEALYNQIAPFGNATALNRLDPFWLYRAVDRALQGADLAAELADAQIFTEQYLACVQSGEASGACARQVDPTYAGFAQ